MVKKQAKTKEKEDNEEILQDEKKKSETYLNQYKYLKADFENYKKIIEKDKLNIIQCGNQKLISELLSVIDDIENAIRNTKDKELKKGLVIIHNNLLKVLEKNGLKQIKAIGEKFDPYYHEVLIKEKSDKKEDVILEEIQKGYMLNNRVIRHSKVKISCS